MMTRSIFLFFICSIRPFYIYLFQIGPLQILPDTIHRVLSVTILQNTQFAYYRGELNSGDNMMVKSATFSIETNDIKEIFAFPNSVIQVEADESLSPVETFLTTSLQIYGFKEKLNSAFIHKIYVSNSLNFPSKLTKSLTKKNFYLLSFTPSKELVRFKSPFDFFAISYARIIRVDNTDKICQQDQSLFFFGVTTQRSLDFFCIDTDLKAQFFVTVRVHKVVILSRSFILKPLEEKEVRLAGLPCDQLKSDAYVMPMPGGQNMSFYSLTLDIECLV